MSDSPLVSIICTVYNHDLYLKDCLNGIVRQKTDFPLEVLIHDDASTDKSADIIREYEKQYPEIIHPIYQTENQYSKGVKIVTGIMFPKAEGKYIAICEGDDYWTDPYKLQKQVNYMESHPDCNLCVHNVIEHWENGENPDKLFYPLEDRDYSGLEVCSNWLLSTCSFLCRTSAFKRYCEIRNKVSLTFGDTPLALSCANEGLIHALPDVMGVYRRNTSSFTLTHEPIKYYKTGKSWELLYHLFGVKYKAVSLSEAVYNYIMGAYYALKRKKIGLFLRCFTKSFVLHPVASILKVKNIWLEKRVRTR